MNDRKDKLIRKLEEYIALLERELNDMAGIAWIYGFESDDIRIREGKQLREEIEKLKRL